MSIHTRVCGTFDDVMSVHARVEGTEKNFHFFVIIEK